MIEWAANEFAVRRGYRASSRHVGPWHGKLDRASETQCVPPGRNDRNRLDWASVGRSARGRRLLLLTAHAGRPASSACRCGYSICDASAQRPVEHHIASVRLQLRLLPPIGSRCSSERNRTYASSSERDTDTVVAGVGSRAMAAMPAGYERSWFGLRIS